MILYRVRVIIWYFKATFKQYFNYIVAVSFNGGGNRSARKKPPKKSLTALSYNVVSSTPRLSEIRTHNASGYMQ